MASRRLVVEFVGDTDKLEKSFKRVGNQADTTSRRVSKAGRAIGMGIGAGVVAGGAALASFTKAAVNAEKSQASMEAQLKAVGISYKAHSREIETAIQKTAKLAAVDDEDLQDAFTNIVRITGDVSKSLKLSGLAADFARAKGIGLAKAGELVGKVAGGNTGILSRYGIQIDKGATSTEALGALQKKFAGQAEAYGKTAAGAQDRLRNSFENLQEQLGQYLLPILVKVVSGLNDLVTAASRLDFGKFTGGFRGVTEAGAKLAGVQAQLAPLWADLREFADTIAPAMEAAGVVLLAAMKRTFAGIAQALQGTLTLLRGFTTFLSGVFTLDIKKAWAGVKLIFSGALNSIVGFLRAATAPIREAMVRIMEGIKNAVSAGWSAVERMTASAWGGVRDTILGALRVARDTIGEILQGINNRMNSAFAAIKTAANEVRKGVFSAFDSAGKTILRVAGYFDRVLQAVKDVVSWIGKIKIPKINLPDLNPFGGEGNGTTVGPAPSLGGGVNSVTPLAGAFGLSMTSGYRPGDDGWHGQNRARDYAGPAGAMRRFAAFMAASYGPRLLELIYTPLGFGIKNGQRIPSFGAAVDADHFDHVHVAMAKGGSVKKSGWAVVGEKGPELAHLPGGARVYPNGESMAALGGRGSTVVEQHFHLHGTLIRESEVMSWMQGLERKYSRSNAKPAFGGAR